MGWDADTWTALGTWATVAVATGAATAALRQVREARRLREAQAQPFIVVVLEPDPVDSTIIQLRVENIGQTLARDVRFTFTPPLRSAFDERSDDEHGLAESPLLKQGISAMPPGMKLERILDVTTEWGDNGPPVQRYDVEVTFSDRHGRAEDPLRYSIDLSAFMSGTFIVRKSVPDGVRSLIAIEKELKKWTEGIGNTPGINVWTRDGDAKDTARQRRNAERIAAQEATASSRAAISPESTDQD